MDNSPELQLDGSGNGPEAHQKRTRVLLSCAPCRASKLKCDRAAPCTNCLKKGRPDGCVYAPKPEKVKPAKSMAARLKRLEGMVRGMLDGEGNAAVPREPAGETAPLTSAGQVVQGGRATTYVGATHFMAMLDDIEDLKSYFDEEGGDIEDGPDASSSPETDSPEMLMLSKGMLRRKQDLLSLLPDKQVIDRLIMRYFSSNSPSQHTVHRPTFVKQYNEFWANPSKVDIEWLALLFMVMALGIFFSSWAAPHELQSDSTVPPMERFKHYRAAAGWALVAGGYSNPGPRTPQPLLLYVEAEFLANRASQTNCWLLSGLLIRIMLKMGLHRDPSRLAAISPFDGEMRRRMWNLAIQIDLIVSFHMGQPGMIHGIESDCNLPRNIVDEDFSEDSAELPPGRPITEYTHMSYPIFKSIICRVFGQVARLAHALTVPPYSEVMRVDGLLEEKWRGIPSFMKARPLEECVTDLPIQVVHRFGIASLYQKSRCVLHRRYLVEAAPRKEHEYSRRACLEAALALLEYQDTIYRAAQPGGMLSQNGWFITGLAMHDFLLAAMIVYLVAQNESYSEVGGNYDWMTQDTPLPDKEKLVDLLRRSRRIWLDVADEKPAVKKAADILDVMLRKIQARRAPGAAAAAAAEPGGGGGTRVGASREAEDTPMETPMSNLAIGVQAQYPSANAANIGPSEPQMAFSRQDLMPNQTTPTGFDSWIPMTSAALDWGSVDAGIRISSTVQQQMNDSDWQGQEPLSDLDIMADGFWNPDGPVAPP